MVRNSITLGHISRTWRRPIVGLFTSRIICTETIAEELQKLACASITAAVRVYPMTSVETASNKGHLQNAWGYKRGGEIPQSKEDWHFSKENPELLIPWSTMTTKFHFRKKSERRWSNKTYW